MKKIIVIGIVIWLVLALSVGAFAFENEPDGFRDLNWGDPPSEDMISSYYEEDMAMYYLPEDKMFLGDVPLYLVDTSSLKTVSMVRHSILRVRRTTTK